MNAQHMAACSWWQQYGQKVPKLQKVAVFVLGQPSGAGAAERGHKEMNFIKSKARNHLGRQNTNDLTYIRFNANMTEKIEADDYRLPVPALASCEGDNDKSSDEDDDLGDMEVDALAKARISWLEGSDDDDDQAMPDGGDNNSEEAGAGEDGYDTWAQCRDFS